MISELDGANTEIRAYLDAMFPGRWVQTRWTPKPTAVCQLWQRSKRGGRRYGAMNTGRINLSLGYLQSNEERSHCNPVAKFLVFTHNVSIALCNCGFMVFFNISLKLSSKFWPILYFNTILPSTSSSLLLMVCYSNFLRTSRIPHAANPPPIAQPTYIGLTVK
jgi:hypothetical protein